MLQPHIPARHSFRRFPAIAGPRRRSQGPASLPPPMHTRHTLYFRAAVLAIFALIPAILFAAVAPRRASAPNFDKRLPAAAAAAAVSQPAVLAAERALAA